MKFKSLNTRITFIFLVLILSIQIIGSIAIRFSIEKNARASVSEQLALGEKIFLSLLNQNSESLTQGARILAIDYGFRQAIASNDEETILSALNNQQKRLGANISVFYTSSNFYPTADDHQIVEGEKIYEVVKSAVTVLVETAQESGDFKSFAIFNNEPYQLVAVPVKAPLTIGWVIMGFKIDNTLAKKLHKLSNLEVTFVSKSNNANWSLIASTLNSSSFNNIMTQPSNVLDTNSMNREIHIDGVSFGSRYVSILKSPNQVLYAVLQRSIDEATAPYKNLQLTLLILTIFGAFVFAISIYYVSKYITKPITDLVQVAKSLEKGNYAINITSDRADELGELSRSFSSMSEAISSREKSISRLAYYDELTHLPNRTSFMLTLNKALEEAKLTKQQLTIFVLNLNRFKQINNILGHDSGDEILRVIAEKIKMTAREQDFVARIAGIQYAMILPDTTSEIGLSLADEISRSFENPIIINMQSVDVSASIGIATFPTHANNEAQLLTRAEIAMYAAKANKVGTTVFDKSYDLNSSTNLSMASELKNAITDNQLIMYVQPKIDIATSKLTSLEALVRWKHPEKGFIFPDQFIPFAEQTGYIQLISQWMLNEAAKYSQMWNALNLHYPIAVNISTRDLIDQDLPEKIDAIFKTYHIDHSSLTLEITESSIMDDPVRALATLDKLSGMNIKLSIDDFGTGYSSLAYLKRLPVNELKIDKSFILKMEQDESDKKIVQSTIDLGHNLGLKVVAEGIENLIVWKLLRSMGCDSGQGYYMSKPMPASDFVKWISLWDNSSIFKETQLNID
ncbi:MAG: EAL domain-containing protein [Methylotenera sp.]|uniref:bifunctional diguanylate cyclase/phosphodiesterase n=1 Tax=Methylotenera sp. TaxID=2051956 RepID=UPI0024897E14|nr:EAL domain-containing protein [Methylotenera sp.]MDI1309948.1 EAL domain-containing protein [Methylotenera sp.]